MRTPMIRVTGVFLRRLALPLALFATFNALSVLVYASLEGLPWLDALFWITHPHAVEPHAVGKATKVFALLVYTGVFAFQIWIAERILVTIFSRQGTEAWRSMINDVNLDSVRDHFIICGYGQVGRTLEDQLTRLHVPFVLVETDERLHRELLHEGILVVRGDAKQPDVLRAAGIERARGICIVIDNDADNLYITVTAKALNPRARIITRAGQERYAQAMRNSGADEVVIPEHEGGLMVGRIVEKHYPVPGET